MRALLIIALAFCIVSCRHRKEQAATARVKPRPDTPVVKQDTKKSMPAGGGEDWQKALGLTSRQVKESRLYSFIGEWYGVPYRYGGCVKAGVDCSCFASLLNEKVYNRSLPRSANDMFLKAEKFDIRHAREGDLLFFKINSKQVSHVGVYLGRRMFVHSSTSRGVSVNSLDEAYYSKYFYCAGRIGEK